MCLLLTAMFLIPTSPLFVMSTRSTVTGMLDAHTLVPRRESVEEFASSGECVLYHPARDEATALNRSATEIWTLCDGRLTVAAIARALGERYGLDQELFVDEVAETLQTLRARGLVGFSTVPDPS